MSTVTLRRRKGESDFDLATRAWQMHCRAIRAVPSQPCRLDTEYKGDLVVLRNVNGLLDAFRIKGDRVAGPVFFDDPEADVETRIERLAEEAGMHASFDGSTWSVADPHFGTVYVEGLTEDEVIADLIERTNAATV